MGYADLAERGHLYVFPTEQGFGSDVAFDPVNNPLLKRIGPLGDLENATVNDAFRIVHDLYGHYGPGNPFFRAPGEERAFKLHSRMYSPEARPAMASETRGQNSWLNFGPYGSYNRGANAAETIYADQKTGIMPPWTYEKADGGVVDDALRIAKDVGGSTPVLMEDAKGNKYDAKGNIIPPQSPGPNPARVSDPTLERAGMMDIGEPENYEAEVKPFIDAATMPMNYSEPSPDAFVGVQTEEPSLLETMKIAGKLAASGQPSDNRGEMNLSRNREEAVRRFVGAPEGGETSAYRGPFTYNPSDTASYLNTLIDFSPYSFAEMAHDIPYEGVRTGDYGTAATEGALNAALTAPGIAALGAAGRAGFNALRKNPKVAAGLAGVGAFLSSDEAEAGPERWFSKLYRSAEALPMEKMTGEQALAMLRKTAPQEEIKWTGLEGFASENPVTTKKALLDFLKRNQVQTQDVVLGGSNKPTSIGDVQVGPEVRSLFKDRLDDLAARRSELDRIFDTAPTESPEFQQAKLMRGEYRNEANALQREMVDEEIKRMGGLARAPKYESYSTPGGKGYQETVITLGGKSKPQVVEKNRMWHLVGPDGETMRNQSGGPYTYYTENDAQRAASSLYRESGKYRSSHWDEPDVIGHLRSQMLTATPPGASRPMKLFNVDEAQSDWAQDARKRGFFDPAISAAWQKEYWANKEAVKNAKNALDDAVVRATRDLGPEPTSTFSNAFNEYYDRRFAVLNADPDVVAARKQLDAAIKREAEVKASEPKFGGVPAAPYVTSTQGWTDLSIKKSLDQAIDSGADYFTFTPGEVQAERYDLSKQISKVQYNPDDGSLLAYDPKGKMVVNESVNDPSDLDDYLGKELAEKMRGEAESRQSSLREALEVGEGDDGYWTVYMNGEPMYADNGEPLSFTSTGKAKDYINEMIANDYANNPAELSGLDLKVGGEGMIDYYNNIYKKRVEKVVKDLTGKKVQWEVLPAETSEGIVPRLGFRIDDDLREAKFPTFASGGVVNKALQLTRDY
jgi:hypothetical protein